MIKFRRACVNDAELLAAARQKVWASTYRDIYPDEMIDNYDLAAFTARDRARLQRPNLTHYLVMDGEQCVGYFSYGAPVYGAWRDFTLCLNSLYLLPEYRGRGLGTRVFVHLREVCAAQKVDKFFCNCNCHNLPAQHFYRKMGGVVTCISDGHENKAEDQMTFEFYLGESYVN